MAQSLSDFLLKLLPPETAETLKGASLEEIFFVVAFVLVVVVVMLAVYLFVLRLILKLIKRIFRRFDKNNGNSLTYQFLEKAITLGAVIAFVVIPLGGDRLAESLLGSTAVAAAVVGLAANDVIKDMFAGLQISIYKPFDVGSRIMFEDGRAGIVESMTLRHIVLRLIDTTRIILPNSRANTMIIVNYSYEEHVPRAQDFRFAIGYDSDVDKAKEIIRTTICDSPLTLNRDIYNEEDPSSRSVYFLEIAESALIMGATVYYPSNLRTEVVKDEVNTKVFRALKEAGIEIPYNYMSVVIEK